MSARYVSITHDCEHLDYHDLLQAYVQGLKPSWGADELAANMVLDLQTRCQFMTKKAAGEARPPYVDFIIMRCARDVAMDDIFHKNDHYTCVVRISKIEKDTWQPRAPARRTIPVARIQIWPASPMATPTHVHHGVFDYDDYDTWFMCPDEADDISVSFRSDQYHIPPSHLYVPTDGQVPDWGHAAMRLDVTAVHLPGPPSTGPPFRPERYTADAAPHLCVLDTLQRLLAHTHWSQKL
jgi:hypothetical protein